MHYFTLICNHDRYNYEKLLERVEQILCLESNRLPLLKNAPPSLLQTDYKSVKFWLEKAYEAYQKWDNSNTNGLAIRKLRHGRPSNSSEDDDKKHPYLEDGEGVPVDWHWLTKFMTRLEKSSILYNMLSLCHPPGVNWDLMLTNISGLRWWLSLRSSISLKDLGNWTNGQYMHMPHGGRTFGDRKVRPGSTLGGSGNIQALQSLFSMMLAYWRWKALTMTCTTQMPQPKISTSLPPTCPCLKLCWVAPWWLKPMSVSHC